MHFGSGIRSGHDVVEALAMGAKGVYIGRAYIFDLGAMGQAGVTKALEIIHMELDKTIALCGRRKVMEQDRDNMLIPEDAGESLRNRKPFRKGRMN